MSSYGREQYMELSKVANEQAMQLGELHAYIKLVLGTWEAINPVAVRAVDDDEQEYVNAERMQAALSKLEAAYVRQRDELLAKEDEA